MRTFVCIGVWAWTLTMSSIAFGLLPGSGDMRDFFATLALGWAPVAALACKWKIEMRSEGMSQDACAMQAGVDEDSCFFHRESGTALALNTRARTVTVADGECVRTYSFDDVCQWASRSATTVDISVADDLDPICGAGLIMSVRIGPRRAWHISMRKKEKRERWFGMLAKAIADDEAHRAIGRAARDPR